MKFLPQLMERLESNLGSGFQIMLPISKSQWEEFKASPIYAICANRYTDAFQQIKNWEDKTEDEKLEDWSNNPFNPETFPVNRKPNVLLWFHRSEDGLCVTTYSPVEVGGEVWGFQTELLGEETEVVEWKGKYAIYHLTEMGLGWYTSYFIDDLVPKFSVRLAMSITDACYSAIKTKEGQDYIKSMS